MFKRKGGGREKGKEIQLKKSEKKNSLKIKTD